MDGPSHFDEKSGIIASIHEWGRWHQSVQEVNVEINLTPGTTARQLSVAIGPSDLECRVKDDAKILLKGKLFGRILVDESIWTIEDKRLLRIVLAKTDSSTNEGVWTSLFRDGEFAADKETEKRMRSKLDLERFQMEYPGMNFSGARLQ